MPHITRAQYDKAVSAGIITPRPAPNPLPGGVRVSIYQELDGQEVLNIWDFKQTTAPTPENLNTYAEQCALGWKNHIMPELSDQCTLVKARAQDISVHNGGYADYELTPPQAGGLTGSFEGTFVAAGVVLNTGVSGRAFTGAKRLGGIPAALLVNGVFTAGYTTALNSALADWVTYVNTNTAGSLVVVSFFQNKAARPVPVASYIVSATLKSRGTTQNSRKVGRGA